MLYEAWTMQALHSLPPCFYSNSQRTQPWNTGRCHLEDMLLAFT